MKYQLITGNAHLIKTGDIIKVNQEIHNNNILSKKWNKQFIKVNRFFKVLTISNNGNIEAIDHRNKIHYLYVLDKYTPILAVYRTI